MRRSELIAVGIVIILFAVGIYVYPQLPDTIASHWNAQGQVNGYTSKFWGLFLLAIISVGLVLLFVVIPRIDPLKANIEKFRTFYDRFVILFLVFFFYFYLLTILWNMGVQYNFNQVLAPAFGGLFYYIGVVTEHAKRNWFVGIRTPWTLSSESVWDKTHAIGAKLFKIVGVVALLGVLFPNYTIFFILVPVLIVAGYLIVYSYVVYQREMGLGYRLGEDVDLR
ncbi:MAG TPA: SdpI family protein [Candidatus Acidoferrales bacterium]|nr:SdpI family protein [Candidatus Acidoferrales bacterium]